MNVLAHTYINLMSFEKRNSKLIFFYFHNDLKDKLVFDCFKNSRQQFHMLFILLIMILTYTHVIKRRNSNDLFTFNTFSKVCLFILYCFILFDSNIHLEMV